MVLGPYTNQFANSISVLKNNGDGTFAASNSYGTENSLLKLAIGDFDGDLDLDVATAHQFYDNVSVLLNDGDGTLAKKLRLLRRR